MPDTTSPILSALLQSYGKVNPAMSSWPIRQDQIEQYTHPDKNVMPLSDVQPTALTRNDNFKVRSLDKYLPPGIGLPDSVVGRKLSDLQLPMRLDQSDVQTVDPEHAPFLDSVTKGLDVGHKLGLGKAAFSIGQQGQNPYLSIYDKWDFEEPGGPLTNRYGLFRELLTRAGIPMHLYSRVPIPLDQEGKIPKYIPGYKGQDINLPSEKP